MDFRHSERSEELQKQVSAFLDEHVYPAEHAFEEQAAANRAAGRTFDTPEVLTGLKATARAQGLWNLFLPDERFGAGLSVLDYAPIAELSGRSAALAPEAMNCSAPDTGNMELLAMFGTDEQHEQWLKPAARRRDPVVLLDDRARRRVLGRHEHRRHDHPRRGRVRRRRPQVVVHRLDAPAVPVAIVMGVSDPDASPYARHSMILVPLDADGRDPGALDDGLRLRRRRRTAATA